MFILHVCRASESGRPTRKFLYSTSLRHSSGTGRKGQQDRSKFKMEPIRRSTREKRLVFATLNMSEIDKQILDPKHDYPADVDSSEVKHCRQGAVVSLGTD